MLICFYFEHCSIMLMPLPLSNRTQDCGLYYYCTSIQTTVVFFFYLIQVRCTIFQRTTVTIIALTVCISRRACFIFINCIFNMHLQVQNSLFAKDERVLVLTRMSMLLTIMPCFPHVKINFLVIHFVLVVQIVVCRNLHLFTLSTTQLKQLRMSHVMSLLLKAASKGMRQQTLLEIQKMSNTFLVQANSLPLIKNINWLSHFFHEFMNNNKLVSTYNMGKKILD